MNYIDDLAEDIYESVEGHVPANRDDLALYRIYAVLCLSKGQAVTNEDVHNAWAAWQAEMNPEHRSLVPFRELSPATQALDEPYRDAIRAVAARRAAKAFKGG